VPAVRTEPAPEVLAPAQLVNEAGDDRASIQPGDDVLLIVENDLPFARLMLDSVREAGFKGLVTSLGAAALAMVREYKPRAITLDICLPDIDGWRVLERLKNDLSTRHIPVCVISTEEARERAFALGALDFVPKPVQTREALDAVVGRLRDFVARPVKHLLVVEPDPAERDRLLALFALDDVAAHGVADGHSALQALRDRPADCVVLNPRLPDMSAAALAKDVADLPMGRRMPVVAPVPDNLPAEAEAGLRQLGEAVVLRRAQSRERLLDQVMFLLHGSVAKMPPARRLMLEDLYQTDRVLEGKKVLIVDDDIRNIFALSSVLEWRNMKIVSAETGRDAIALLQAQPDVDVVLMDIMMPEMDGYETIRAIRRLPHFKALPIIAVTAKAMKGDREKCIEAGAWDYLSKPVDPEQMLAVLCAWLNR
jgi:CheY-like chemotaxis protein